MLIKHVWLSFKFLLKSPITSYVQICIHNSRGWIDASQQQRFTFSVKFADIANNQTNVYVDHFNSVLLFLRLSDDSLHSWSPILSFLGLIDELCRNYLYSTMCTCVRACLHVCYAPVFLAEDTFCSVGVSICATHWVKLLCAASCFILVALGLFTHANWHYPSAGIERNNATLWLSWWIHFS